MARLNHVKKFRGTSKTADGNLTCGRCGDKIQPGDGYRWWSNRAPGSRSGYKQVRCMKSECTPSLAERTPGRAGQLLQIQEDAGQAIDALTEFTDTGDLESLAADLAERVRELAQELQESAENIESGFGHETTQSTELRERGDNLEMQADEIESLDFDEFEEDEELDDEELESARENWREEERGKLQEAIDSVDIY